MDSVDAWGVLFKINGNVSIALCLVRYSLLKYCNGVNALLTNSVKHKKLYLAGQCNYMIDSSLLELMFDMTTVDSNLIGCCGLQPMCEQSWPCTNMCFVEPAG